MKNLAKQKQPVTDADIVKAMRVKLRVATATIKHMQGTNERLIKRQDEYLKGIRELENFRYRVEEIENDLGYLRSVFRDAQCGCVVPKHVLDGDVFSVTQFASWLDCVIKHHVNAAQTGESTRHDNVPQEN